MFGRFSDLYEEDQARGKASGQNSNNDVHDRFLMSSKVFPNAEFLRQLLDFEQELFGERRTDTESLPGPFKRSLLEHLSIRLVKPPS